MKTSSASSVINYQCKWNTCRFPPLRSPTVNQVKYENPISLYYLKLLQEGIEHPSEAVAAEALRNPADSASPNHIVPTCLRSVDFLLFTTIVSRLRARRAVSPRVIKEDPIHFSPGRDPTRRIANRSYRFRQVDGVAARVLSFLQRLLVFQRRPGNIPE